MERSGGIYGEEGREIIYRAFHVILICLILGFILICLDVDISIVVNIMDLKDIILSDHIVPSFALLFPLVIFPEALHSHL